MAIGNVYVIAAIAIVGGGLFGYAMLFYFIYRESNQ